MFAHPRASSDHFGLWQGPAFGVPTVFGDPSQSLWAGGLGWRRQPGAFTKAHASIPRSTEICFWRLGGSDQLRSEPSEGFPRILFRPGSPRPARAASNKRSNHVQKSLRLLSASVRFFGFDRQCKLDQPPNSFWASSRNVLLRNPCIETRRRAGCNRTRIGIPLPVGGGPLFFRDITD